MKYSTCKCTLSCKYTCKLMVLIAVVHICTYILMLFSINVYIVHVYKCVCLQMHLYANVHTCKCACL